MPMPTSSIQRHVLDRGPIHREVAQRAHGESSDPSRLLPKVYLLGVNKSCSMLTLSSLSLSQSSNASSPNSPIFSWEAKIPVPSFRGVFSSWDTKGDLSGGKALGRSSDDDDDDDDGGGDGDLSNDIQIRKRCNWITKTSDELYVSFHDDCWGVPVYEDNELFELLALSGMLIDQNWTQILRRKELYREAFAKFDHVVVAAMKERDIVEISSNKELMLAERRVRCIVDNARCLQKVAKEFGSFSVYIWGHLNHKPMINKYKHPKSIPLRTAKSDAISKDLQRRGFRLVSPVIVYAFMQAAGMSIDHLVDCFRFRDCVRLAGGVAMATCSTACI